MKKFIYTTRLDFKLLKRFFTAVKSKLSASGPSIQINIALLRLCASKEFLSAVLVNFSTEKPLSQSAVVTVITSNARITVITAKCWSWYKSTSLIIVL